MKDIFKSDVHPAWALAVLLVTATVAGTCTYYAVGAALTIWGR